MTKIYLTWLLVALICPAGKSQYAIRNVSIIPMNEESVLHGQTIIVEGGVIRNLGPSGSIRIDRGLEVIDGSGKYLIPGLMDMHTHFFSDVGDDRGTWDKELKLMFASGIATARLMTGHPTYLGLKRKVEAGELLGPELFVVSPQLVGRWPWSQDFRNFELTDTPEKGAAAVKRFKEEGYSEIKITFMVEAAVYDAIIRTAWETGIKVTGHVGPLVGLPRALEARQQIEHMDQFTEMLLPDTSYNHGQSISDFNIYSKDAWATVPHLDEAKIVPLALMVRNAGISVTPTNYFMISSFCNLPADEEILRMPDYEFIPPALRDDKWKYRKNYMSKMAPEESRQRYIALRKKMTYELWKAGVPLMTGSDSPEYFIVAGIALHDELRAMVEAGLTPFAALQTATVNPANYLGIASRTGTIEVGKEANLLLLNGNPLDDIRNTRSIVTICHGDKYYDRAAVNTMLEEARALGR